MPGSFSPNSGMLQTGFWLFFAGCGNQPNFIRRGIRNNHLRRSVGQKNYRGGTLDHRRHSKLTRCLSASGAKRDLRAGNKQCRYGNNFKHGKTISPFWVLVAGFFGGKKGPGELLRADELAYQAVNSASSRLNQLARSRILAGAETGKLGPTQDDGEFVVDGMNKFLG